MRYNRFGFVVVLLICSPTFAKERRPTPSPPSHFEIARHTFFDFGPPFDFYELFIVRPTAQGSSVERITLTPAGDQCTVPAKLETASASITESVAALLDSTNPCAIPDKELQHELKRRRRRLVFSGANVVMQVPCGNGIRLIRSDILDRDMFDAAPHTPQHTSWTMRLLERLDRAVGPGVMDKSVFSSLAERALPARVSDSATLQDLRAGMFDGLFSGAPDKPSDSYHAAQKPPPPTPTVRLVSSLPLAPEVLVQPDFPPLARMARVQGIVSVEFEVDPEGQVSNVAIESGHPLLREAVKKAVNGWRFPKGGSSQEIQVKFEFALNCPARSE